MNTEQIYKGLAIAAVIILLAYMAALVHRQWNENLLIAREVKADIERKNQLNDAIKEQIAKTPEPKQDVAPAPARKRFFLPWR